MGESKTPQPFISACNQFKYLDLLLEQKIEEEAAAEAAVAARNAKTAAGKTSAAKTRTKQQKDLEKKRQKDLNRVRNTIDAILEKFSDDDGWIFSGKLGDQLSKRMPDFDVRNFGFSKFTSFIKSLGSYEYNEILDNNHQKQIYFRRRVKDADKTK